MSTLSPEENQRYRRHFSLEQIGPEGQRQLKTQSVLLIGAGGIGSPASLYLAAAGIGRLGIVDDDQIELSNLQRQILYQTDDCGKKKTAVAAKRLEQLNPHVQVEPHNTRLTVENAQDIVQHYDLVIDGSDNFPTRYLTNDICARLHKPLISASIFQFSGQLAVFHMKNGPCYRCLYPAPPSNNTILNCSQAGVLGVIPGILATLAVNETLKFLLNIGSPMTSKLIRFDALQTTLKTYQIPTSSDCPTCQKQVPFENLPRYQDDICETKNTITEITATELQQTLQTKHPPLLLDVRELWERQICALDDHAHIPLDQINKTVLPFQTNDSIVVYCHAGIRSLIAAKQLKQHGFANVMSLQHGIRAWIQQIDPTLQDY